MRGWRSSSSTRPPSTRRSLRSLRLTLLWGPNRPSVSSGLARREIRWGLLFLSPWILGFLVFTLLPMVASLAFSLTNYNPIHPEQLQFVGLTNYGRMFSD